MHVSMCTVHGNFQTIAGEIFNQNCKKKSTTEIATNMNRINL